MILKIPTLQDLFRIDVPDNDETFQFNLEDTKYYETAIQMLQLDQNLANIRFYLVPRL